MATFCSKCGTSLSSATGFCPSCGTPIGSPAAAPPPQVAAAQVQAFPPQAVYGQVAAYPVVPPKKSSSTLKVVLIVIAVVVGLGVLGVGAAAYIAYRALHTGGNSFSMGSSAQITEADLGVAIYPGAVAKANMETRVKIGNATIVSGTYTTSDPVSSVVTFYQSKVGGQAIENKTVTGTSFESSTTNGTEKDSLVVTIAPDRTNSSVTQIVILHTASTSSTTTTAPAAPTAPATQ